MWRLGVAAFAIAAVIGVLANAKQSGKLEERASVAKEAETKNAQASANRRTVTDDTVKRMLEKYYRDKP